MDDNMRLISSPIRSSFRSTSVSAWSGGTGRDPVGFITSWYDIIIVLTTR